MAAAVYRSWYASSKKRAVTTPFRLTKKVPGCGIPYERVPGSACSFRMPKRLMIADPLSEISGNRIPRESANFLSVAGGS